MLSAITSHCFGNRFGLSLSKSYFLLSTSRPRINHTGSPRLFLLRESLITESCIVLYLLSFLNPYVLENFCLSYLYILSAYFCQHFKETRLGKQNHTGQLYIIKNISPKSCKFYVPSSLFLWEAGRVLRPLQVSFIWVLYLLQLFLLFLKVIFLDHGSFGFKSCFVSTSFW